MEVNATFEQITQLINDKNFTSSGFSANLQNLASEGNHIFVIIDKMGNTFIAEVHYDPETKGIQPPLAQQVLHLINLPPPILTEVTVGMRLSDVLSMCRTNKYLNGLICESDDFWKKKFIYDFGVEEITTEEKGFVPTPKYWREKYRNFGKVYSFGSNNFGQLGLGDDINRDIPTEVPGPGGIKFKAVSANGFKHSLILSQDGKVYSFGINVKGQLGLGSTDISMVYVPTEIRVLEGIKIEGVSTGGDHSLAMSVDGKVYSFGKNDRGQLGLGDNIMRNIPIEIPGLDYVVGAISTGMSHSLILSVDGKVYSFGANGSGQLGLGDYGDGTDRNIPTEIPGLDGMVKAVSAGASHSLILGVDGKVWSFGRNSYGELGLGVLMNTHIPTEIPGTGPEGIRAKAISAGGQHSLILSQDDKIYSFGGNFRGQLGLGPEEVGINRSTPTEIPGTGQETGGITAKAISAGLYHSLIIDLNDNVHSFGRNEFGQLGLGDRGDGTDRNKPTLMSNTKVKSISAGTDRSLVITK